MKLDPRQKAIKELLEKVTGSSLSITQETYDELVAKGATGLDLPITKIDDDNDVVLGCAFWHQHAFPDDKRGLCERCGADICYRPHAAKAKHKVCMNCLPQMVQEMEALEAAEAEKAGEKAAEQQSTPPTPPDQDPNK